MVVNDGDHFFAFLMFVPGIANTITAFLRYRVRAVTMQDAQIELLMVSQMLHTGDEGMFERTVVRPFGKGSVDGGIVDLSLAMVVFGYRQTLPLHAGVEDP